MIKIYAKSLIYHRNSLLIMKNRIPYRNKVATWKNFIDTTKNTIDRSLHEIDLSTVIEGTESDYLAFSIPQIRGECSNHNLKKLNLGFGDIGILQSPRTAWEGTRYNESYWEINRVKYKIMNKIPLDDDEKEAFPNMTIKNWGNSRLWSGAKNKIDLLEAISPRKLKWKGNHGTDYVVSINMDCAYGYESIPRNLSKRIEQKAYEIADKYDLFLGSSSIAKGNCLGFSVGVDTFTLIPEDLESFSMESLIKGIREIGKLTL